MKILYSSLLLLVTTLYVGCGDASGKHQADAPEDKTITLKGKAVDGYLRFSTVCLDLDLNNNCQIGVEPATSTRADGSYELSITKKQQENENYNRAQLIVYGGEDSDTGKYFQGRLISAFDPNNLSTTFITPLTTLVSAVKKKNGSLTKKEAEEKVAALLGLDADDVKGDPVAKAKSGNTKALSQTLQLQKAVEVLASASSSNAADASAAIMKAMAEGANTVDTSNIQSANQGVTKLIENTPTASLDEKTAACLTAATVVAKNVQSAVDKLDNLSAVDNLEISAVVNSVDNVKEALQEEVKSYNVGETYTTKLTETSAVDDGNFSVKPEDVQKVVIVNVLKSRNLDVNLTDAQLDAIVEKGADINSSFEEISSAIEIASQEDENLSTFAEESQKIVKVEATKATLESAVDQTETLQSILGTKGIYQLSQSSSTDANGTYNTTIIPVKIIMDADASVYYYSFSEENSSFYLEHSQVASESYNSNTIYLSKGTWVTEIGSGAPYFDADGNFRSKRNGREQVVTNTTFNASGLSIQDVITDDSFHTVAFETNDTFSSGAKFYQMTMTETYTAKTGYYIDYYPEYYTDINGTSVITNNNGNFEYNYDQTNTYTSFTELITRNDTEGISDNITTHYTDINGSVIDGYLFFTEPDKVVLFTLDSLIDGNYSISSDGETMSFHFVNEDNSSYTVFQYTSGNKVIQAGKYNVSTKIISSFFPIYPPQNIGYSNLDDFIKAKRNPYSGIFYSCLSDNVGGVQTCVAGYLEANGVLALHKEISGYDDQGNWYSDTNRTDLNGSYEVKTVDGVKMLLLTVPERYQQEWERGTQPLYAVQDGKVRKGHYTLQSETKAKSDEMKYYNKTAIMDMYHAFKPTPKNASRASFIGSSNTPNSGVKPSSHDKKLEKYLKEKAALHRAIYGF